MSGTTDADRAKAAELLGRYWERDVPEWAADEVAAAVAEARAPYERLTADLRALTAELAGRGQANLSHPMFAGEGQLLMQVAARLRAVVAAAEEAGR